MQGLHPLLWSLGPSAHTRTWSCSTGLNELFLKIQSEKQVSTCRLRRFQHRHTKQSDLAGKRFRVQTANDESCATRAQHGYSYNPYCCCWTMLQPDRRLVGSQLIQPYLWPLHMGPKNTYIARFLVEGSTLGITFYKQLKNVSCEYDRLNDWKSTLQAA